MTENRKDDETWETPSLEWLHRVRRESQAAREGQAVKVMSRARAEDLAQRHGLKLVRPPTSVR